jgi:BMFP domain-containing protein YqiC
MPNNDMGNPANITNKTFEDAAKAMRQSGEDAKKNARQLLDKVINSQQQSNDKNWKP